MPGVLTLTAIGYRTSIVFVWDAVTGATSYRLQLGTATGESDVYNVNLGNVLTRTMSLGYGTYYVRVVPYTGLEAGVATGEEVLTV